jgi:hypothetical protein
LLQTCIAVLKSMKEGRLGPLDEKTMDDYRQRCRDLFPLAAAFRQNCTTLSANTNNSSSCPVSAKTPVPPTATEVLTNGLS